MNILHLKYAVEVARCGSINQAAEALYINQPNLSRAIKELENSLGITIFDRTAKGMFVTPEGEEFLGYAKKILSQIDEVESIYKAGVPIKQRFSIQVIQFRLYFFQFHPAPPAIRFLQSLFQARSNVIFPSLPLRKSSRIARAVFS